MSPLIQDFCLTANGLHNDLEVFIIPLGSVTPGFNTQYKIVFKNKGTTTQSGSVSFNYNDNLTDYLAATLAPISQTNGVITWNFANLQPFETRSITATLKMNSPTQVPPLVANDILVFTSQITGGLDETPSNNQFNLSQTAVNSYDPNDKTCLEGNTITQTQVGDYVHYLIRFENTGTAIAQNIVVKDEIDLSKFDITSVQPINGSHSFITKVSGNTIEFIFENIQLPYTNSSNDGYIMFKIKTKSTLSVGDSFSNFAKIYFDYNFPIITNTYTTTILGGVLSTLETSHDNDLITIFPNPVTDILKIKSSKKIIKAEIFDSAGKILLSTKVNNDSINASSLITGFYLIKLYSSEDILIKKFIKK